MQKRREKKLLKFVARKRYTLRQEELVPDRLKVYLSKMEKCLIHAECLQFGAWVTALSSLEMPEKKSVRKGGCI